MKIITVVCLSLVALLQVSSIAGSIPATAVVESTHSLSGNPPHVAEERRLQNTTLTGEYEFIQGNQDFQWELDASDRFVDVLRNDTTNQATILFHFDTGNSAPFKTFKTALLEEGCVTTAYLSDALTASIDDSLSTNLSVAVSINQSLIGASSYYEASSTNASGTIRFCLLVEYFYVDPMDPSKEVLMNFLHTEVYISVGLEVSFSLASVETRVERGVVWTSVSYEFVVTASLCDGRDPETPFAQGSVLHLCVSAPANETYSVASVKSLVMSQEGAGSISVALIADNEDSLFSDTICGSEECRIMIQIPTVFYDSREPSATLSLDGVAEVSLENSTIPGRRRLYEDETLNGLPETSTGFHARVFITYPDDNEENESSGGVDWKPTNGVLSSLVAWALIGVGFLILLVDL